MTELFDDVLFFKVQNDKEKVTESLKDVLRDISFIAMVTGVSAFLGSFAGGLFGKLLTSQKLKNIIKILLS